MLATTLGDHADQVRHDVMSLIKRRDKLTDDYQAELETIELELRDKRATLDDYETFFEWQHQRDGGSATVKEMHRVIYAGGKLSPDEYQLAQTLALHIPEEQRPDVAQQVPVNA